MTAENKLMVLEEVEKTVLPKRVTLKHMSIAPSTYYRWRSAYENEGIDGLEDRPSNSLRVWSWLSVKTFRIR